MRVHTAESPLLANDMSPPCSNQGLRGTEQWYRTLN